MKTAVKTSALVAGTVAELKEFAKMQGGKPMSPAQARQLRTAIEQQNSSTAATAD